MPGLVAFRRRWSIGSDDLAVPGAFFFLLHAIWLTVLSAALAVSDLSSEVPCQLQLWEYILGYLIILGGCLLLEACIVGVSMRGTILEAAPREATQYLIYVRAGVMAVEIAWLAVGVIWLVKYYHSCQAPTAKEALIGAVICNWISVASALVMVWCTFDPAGRSWVKMKNYQRTMKDGQKKYQYKRSGSHHRNWRQRKVLRAYRDSWDNRCRMLFCCMDRSDRNQNSFADIAQLLSEFFRDLDVVPSDIVAGLVLLRRVQKLERNSIVNSNSNDTYEFLSGVKVTPASQFLALNQPDQLAFFKDVIHYMRLAMSIYGWPVFMMQHSSTGCCRLCPYLKGGCRRPPTTAEVVEDNCCLCNTAATQRMAPLEDLDLVYVTYHVDVGETPFMVAVDHRRGTVIVCIRGTMSTKDVVTDLECEGEPIPTEPLRDDWLGHKGMVQTARYIRDKLASEQLLERAFARASARASDTGDYRLVLAGHSLGAGTAAILAILLRDQYPDLRCFAYSPPGGLLSMPAVEYTKDFITSVVVGKDVVPRIGLHQLEQLRSDLMDVIKHNKQSKWRVIGGGMSCCACCSEEDESRAAACGDLVQRRLAGRQLSAAHPSDSTIALTVHQPLYPPGRMMHVVRHHHGQRSDKSGRCGEPVYQAIWVDNDSFDEVLISPVMIQDHMPDKVLQALQKFLAAHETTAVASPVPAPSDVVQRRRSTTRPLCTGRDPGQVSCSDAVADTDVAGNITGSSQPTAAAGDSAEIPVTPESSFTTAAADRRHCEADKAVSSGCVADTVASERTESSDSACLRQRGSGIAVFARTGLELSLRHVEQNGMSCKTNSPTGRSGQWGTDTAVSTGRTDTRDGDTCGASGAVNAPAGGTSNGSVERQDDGTESQPDLSDTVRPDRPEPPDVSAEPSAALATVSSADSLQRRLTDQAGLECTWV